MFWQEVKANRSVGCRRWLASFPLADRELTRYVTGQRLGCAYAAHLEDIRYNLCCFLLIPFLLLSRSCLP